MRQSKDEIIEMYLRAELYERLDCYENEDYKANSIYRNCFAKKYYSKYGCSYRSYTCPNGISRTKRNCFHGPGKEEKAAY